MRNNVLMLFDKWCSSNPYLGFTTHFHNFLETFSQSQTDYTLHSLHYDESAVYGAHINQILINYCHKFNIKILFLIFQGTSPLNPSFEVLKTLKEMNVKIVVFWPDNNPHDLVLRNQLENIIDLHVTIDNPRSDLTDVRRDGPKTLHLWTPENKNLYYPDTQSVKYSFIGSSRYLDRSIYISELQKLIPDIVIDGGQREKALSPHAYASLIRRSQIGINFSRNPMGSGYEQTKGRVFEVIASRSLLLEEKNSSTRDFFKPDVEYVEFNNVQELVEKLKYYSENTHERESIAERGYQKFINYYTSNHFWEKVMSHIKII